MRSAPAPVEQVDSSGIRRRALTDRIDSMLADTLLQQAQYGVYIVDAATGRDVYGRNFQQLLVPASANKLFVTALALRSLGPQHRFLTEVLGDSVDARGRLRSDLYLKGRGDPGLSTGDLEELAFRLRAAGLERVSGGLVVDPTAFDTSSFGPGWMWDEGPYAYNAPISAVSVNRNTFEVAVAPGAKPGLRLRVRIRPSTGYFGIDNQGVTAFRGVKRSLKVGRKPGSGVETVTVSGALPEADPAQFMLRSVADPAQYCGRLFREALGRQGISVTGRTVTGKAPQGLARLAWVQSKPLYALLQDMNKESDNFTAEMLYRGIMAREAGEDGNGPDTGSGPMEAMMTRLGFGPASYRIVDGSGLSRYNLISPQQLVSVLMDIHEDALVQPELLASLPVAGADGTLLNRMGEEGTFSRVRAKTGTMTGISSLAGFAFGREGRLYCFAMMFNNYTTGAPAVRGLQDSIVAALIETSP